MESVRIAPRCGALFDVTTHVAAPRGEIWPQPFALLGGMPRIMEYLALKLPLCRVRLQYVITQLQNAHVLVLAGGEDANCTDVVRKCVNYAAASLTDAPALQAPYPQFTSLRLQHAANAEKHPVEWRPKSKSGRYGVRDAAYLQPLADRLHDATAYEQCVVDEVAGVAGAGAGSDSNGVFYRHPITSGVHGYCVAEGGALSGTWHPVTQADTTVILNWLLGHPSRSLAQLRSELTKKTLPVATRWALRGRIAATETSHERLKARVRDEREECMRLLSEGSGGSATPKEGVAFMHLTLVVGHMGRKGSGRAALETFLSQCDESGIPVLLEALAQDALPLYYAQYGFRAVKRTREPFTSGSFQRDDVLYMWRPACPAPATPSASSAASCSEEEEEVVEEEAATEEEGEPPQRRPARTDGGDALARLLADTSLEVYPPVKPIQGKLYEAHLSTITANMIALAAALSGGQYNDVCTWAKEFARQVELGETETAFRVDSPEEVAAEVERDAAAAAAANLAGKKRGRSGGGGGGGSRRPPRPSRTTTPPHHSEEGEDGDDVLEMTGGAPVGLLDAPPSIAKAGASLVQSPPRPPPRASPARITVVTDQQQEQQQQQQQMVVPMGADRAPILLQFTNCTVTIHIHTTTGGL